MAALTIFFSSRVSLCGWQVQNLITITINIFLFKSTFLGQNNNNISTEDAKLRPSLLLFFIALNEYRNHHPLFIDKILPHKLNSICRARRFNFSIFHRDISYIIRGPWQIKFPSPSTNKGFQSIGFFAFFSFCEFHFFFLHVIVYRKKKMFN
jgi:hypothetical protein